MSTSTPVGQATVLPRLPVLDSLRGLGALSLLTAHTAFWAGSYTREDGPPKPAPAPATPHAAFPRFD